MQSSEVCNDSTLDRGRLGFLFGRVRRLTPLGRRTLPDPLATASRLGDVGYSAWGENLICRAVQRKRSPC